MESTAKLRGSGRTTAQMKDAPQRAIFIWVNHYLDYPRRLAIALGRSDLQCVAPSWLEDTCHLRGLQGRMLIIDHAAELTDRQLAG